jgi:membrane protease YdiL (CAAX protease family)
MASEPQHDSAGTQATGASPIPALTRRQAGIDVGLAILLIPASALIAALAAGYLLPARSNLLIAIVLQAALSLAGLRVLLAWRSQSWAAIGLSPPTSRDLPRALIVLLSAFGANTILTLSIYAISPETVLAHVEGLRFIASGLTDEVPLAVALALLFLVGFYEELVARGLLLARSRRLFGGYWGPVLFSAALFGLGHFYQGWLGTVQTALLGVVLAAFTIRWRTLWPAIIAHAAVNMLSIVQLERLIAVVAPGS